MYTLTSSSSVQQIFWAIPWVANVPRVKLEANTHQVLRMFIFAFPPLPI